MPSLLKFPKGHLPNGVLTTLWGGGSNIVGVIGEHDECWDNADKRWCKGRSDLDACRCEYIEKYKKCPEPHPDCP